MGHTSTLCLSLGYLPNALRGGRTPTPPRDKVLHRKNPASDGSATGCRPSRSVPASRAPLPTFCPKSRPPGPQRPVNPQPRPTTRELVREGRQPSGALAWSEHLLFKNEQCYSFEKRGRERHGKYYTAAEEGRPSARSAVCSFTAPRHVGRDRKRILQTTQKGMGRGAAPGLLHPVAPQAGVWPPRRLWFSSDSYSYPGARSWGGGNLCFDQEDKMEARRGPSRRRLPLCPSSGRPQEP